MVAANHVISALNLNYIDGLKEVDMNEAELFTHTGIQAIWIKFLSNDTPRILGAHMIAVWWTSWYSSI